MKETLTTQPENEPLSRTGHFEDIIETEGEYALRVKDPNLAAYIAKKLEDDRNGLLEWQKNDHYYTKDRIDNELAWLESCYIERAISDNVEDEFNKRFARIVDVKYKNFLQGDRYGMTGVPAGMEAAMNFLFNDDLKKARVEERIDEKKEEEITRYRAFLVSHANHHGRVEY